MFYRAIRFLFTIICFIAIFYSIEDVNLADIKNSIFEISRSSIGFLFFINFLSLWMIFSRFSTLVHIFNIPLLNRLSTVSSSNLFNMLPVPGLPELNKFLDIKKSTGKENGLYIILTEKLSSVFIYFLIISFLGIVIFFPNTKFYYIFLLLVIIFFTFKNSSNISYINYFVQRLRSLYGEKKIINIYGTIFFQTFLIQTLSIFLPVIILWDMNFLDPSRITLILFFIILNNLISSLPVSFLGFGIRDLSYLSLGTYFEIMPATNLLAIAFILNFFAITNQLLSLLVSLVSSYFTKREKLLQ